MNLIRTFSNIEIILISLFVISYMIYIFRLYRINKHIKVDTQNVFIKFIVRSIYFSLMIISLLGPTFGVDKEEIKVVGKDIIISVDLSESMNAFDIQPSRLEKVKFEMKKIVNEFSSDRIGIIMFSSEAYTQCPLTYDRNALNLFIETLNTGLVPNSGTDFGPALELSLSKLKDDNSEGPDSNSKIIILISDGEDFGDNTESALNEIKDASVKLFTIGVGTLKGSKLIERSGVFKKDREGIEIITKLNSESLIKTANYTNGKYYEISNEINSVDDMISEIKNIKGEVKDVRTIDLSNNKYFYFLISALILMTLDFIFGFKIISI